MSFKTLRDLNLKHKTVLLRADLNVPAKHGHIIDTTRIDRLKPTIDYLKNAGAKIVILSHFGRPNGKFDEQYSLAFLKAPLNKLWDLPVHFADDCIGIQTEQIIEQTLFGEAVLLENLRFHDGEKANDPNFVKALSRLGEIYINDAFSACHRAHASIFGLAQTMPTAAGLLMEAELIALEKALGNPEKPVMGIIGGSKISTKLGVLYNLTEKTNMLFMGGGMANTFLFAQGADIGGSLCEKDMAEETRKIMAHAKTNGCEIILPSDVVVAEELQKGARTETVSAQSIPNGYMALDIGPETIASMTEKIAGCKTVVWNGPLGVFETPPFDEGTTAMARVVAEKTKNGSLISIAGGGDTLAALEHANVSEDYTYLSTAGGAFLEWLEGKELPGVSALNAYKSAA